MSLAGPLRDALRPGSAVDAGSLVLRAEALNRFLRAAEGVVDPEVLAPAHALTDRAGQRLALSRDHTVIALAGATGSGKSSLFNALAGLELSDAGVRRPTTGHAHACVWGEAGVGPLLDWLDIPAQLRFNRESALDAEDEAALRGLVLLDLPDLDSVAAEHREESDRLLELVDLIVWVTDPQKYADRLIHEQYLRAFRRHREITIVVLNQADRLSAADVTRCATDLLGLLEKDGMAGVPVLPSSAVGGPDGVADLRGELEKAVATRQALLRRLERDLDELVEVLSGTVAQPAAEIDSITLLDLAGALSRAAGVPAVAHAVELTYRYRARRALGWPPARYWWRRQDPLARLHLERPGEVTTLPEPTHAQRAAVRLAVRTLADRAGTGLPEPWPQAVAAAAGSRVGELPGALDDTVSRTDLGMRRRGWWWWLVGGLQWLLTLVALGGVVWLIAGLFLPGLGDPTRPALIAGGGLLAGLLLSVLVTPLGTIGSRRARRRAQNRLESAVAEVASEYVIRPVRRTVTRYGEAREALGAARR